MPLNSTSRRALVAGIVAAAGGGGAYYAGRSDGGDDADAGNDTDAGNVSPSFHSSEEESSLGVDLSGKPIVGSADASVDIYYWTDFQCPFCEKFERETLPDLVREYVDPGRVRIVLVPTHMYGGGDSMTAAVAARCVWDQVSESHPEGYWNWHHAVFDRQGEKNAGWASADALVEIARSIDGVDADALETCLDDRRAEFEEAVEADGAQGRSFGVKGTPSFVVFGRATENTEAIGGAQPIERFRDAVESVEES